MVTLPEENIPFLPEMQEKKQKKHSYPKTVKKDLWKC